MQSWLSVSDGRRFRLEMVGETDVFWKDHLLVESHIEPIEPLDLDCRLP
jgi:hypothetical protein